MLTIRGLDAGYGAAPVLRGVDMDVAVGSITALLGRNGAGRSTLCKAVMGLAHAAGSIRFRDTEIIGLPPFQIARIGLGYVPENRDVFPGLSVRQNLILGLKPGARDGSGPWSVQRLFDLFPNLSDRADVPAEKLSGGEQQMLAIARTLMGAPAMILVDEPTEGLSPQMTGRVGTLLEEIARRGVSILLVEQKLSIALKISKRVYVMGHGQMVFEGTPAELADRDDVRKEWLEV